MIPAEAVEAAARATFEHANTGSPWECAGADWRDAYKASLLAGLEAAAPYMFAPVLEVADRLQESTLSGDTYLSGRGSGFRIAGVQIKQALGMEP